MVTAQNIVGPQIRKIRYQMDLTQEQLAARCGVHGFDISRATLAKIEARLRCVVDSELIVIAKALEVSVTSLYPSKQKARSRHQ